MRDLNNVLQNARSKSQIEIHFAPGTTQSDYKRKSKKQKAKLEIFMFLQNGLNKA